VDRREHRARFRVDPYFPRVYRRRQSSLHHVLIAITAEVDLARHDRQSRRHQRLAGDTAHRILRQNRIENGIEI
jgi:hypothetical protein